MIIDTNGFEIGDEVWYKEMRTDSMWISTKNTIRHIVECKDFYIIHTNNIDLFIKSFKSLFHTQSDCQLACDKLNGISHD